MKTSGNSAGYRPPNRSGALDKLKESEALLHDRRGLSINQSIGDAVLSDVACLQSYNGADDPNRCSLAVVAGRSSANEGIGMADKKSLRMFGLFLGGVTMAVALVAAVTVQAQINGRMTPAAIAISR
jgi:hypothetical protein